MELTSNTQVDNIQIGLDKEIVYREMTIVFGDGTPLSRSFKETVKNPGDDLSGVPSEVAAVADVLWTPAVIHAYDEMQARAVV